MRSGGGGETDLREEEGCFLAWVVSEGAFFRLFGGLSAAGSTFSSLGVLAFDPFSFCFSSINRFMALFGMRISVTCSFVSGDLSGRP